MRMSVDLPAQTRELSRSRRDWGVKLLSSQASRSCPASVGAFTGASCCDGEEVRSYITDSECSGPVTESTRPSARPWPTRLQLQPSSWKARSSTMRLTETVRTAALRFQWEEHHSSAYRCQLPSLERPSSSRLSFRAHRGTVTGGTEWAGSQADSLIMMLSGTGRSTGREFH